MYRILLCRTVTRNIVIAPYLTFPGNAREAIQFYTTALGGTVLKQLTFEGMAAPEWKDKIMHAELEICPNQHILISDTSSSDKKVTVGDNIQLSLSFKQNEAQARKIFDAIAKTGEIEMPLETQFWGDVFGIVVDQYGVRWLINSE